MTVRVSKYRIIALQFVLSSIASDLLTKYNLAFLLLLDTVNSSLALQSVYTNHFRKCLPLDASKGVSLFVKLKFCVEKLTVH